METNLKIEESGVIHEVVKGNYNAIEGTLIVRRRM